MSSVFGSSDNYGSEQLFSIMKKSNEDHLGRRMRIVAIEIKIDIERLL
jgi:hypothetical protein